MNKTTDDRREIRPILTLAIAAALGVLGVSMTGCNAVSGLGQDLEESSQNVQDAIQGDGD